MYSSWIVDEVFGHGFADTDDASDDMLDGFDGYLDSISGMSSD